MRFPAQVRHETLVRHHALIPTTDEGRALLKKLGDDDDVMVTVTKTRNIRQFKLFWALCEVIGRGVDMTKYDVKAELCERTRHLEPEFRSDGSMRWRPKSIAFENMPQEEFERFFELATIKASDMLGSAPKQILEEVNRLLDPHYPRSAA